MSKFLARVELHGGAASDYTALHSHLKRVGFKQQFTNSGYIYDLPTGTYLNTRFTQSVAGALSVIEAAARAAGFPPDTRHNKTNHTSSIIVVEFTHPKYSGLRRRRPKPS